MVRNTFLDTDGQPLTKRGAGELMVGFIKDCDALLLDLLELYAEQQQSITIVRHPKTEHRRNTLRKVGWIRPVEGETGALQLSKLLEACPSPIGRVLLPLDHTHVHAQMTPRLR